MTTLTGQSTLLLNSLMESEQGKQALENALSKYPLYVGKKAYDLIPTREELNTKILNYYRFREIGFETAGRFLFELENTMNLIMPQYNELFKTVEIMADLENPFDNVDVIETFSEERKNNTTHDGTTSTTATDESTATAENTQTSSGSSGGTSTTNNTTTDNGTNNMTLKKSDTPQNNVSNINNYLSEYREENATNTNTNTLKGSVTNSEESSGTASATGTSTNTATSTSEGSTVGTTNATGTTNHTYKKKGNQGVNTYAHDMLEFRQTIVDYVERIVKDERLNELFMLVY